MKILFILPAIGKKDNEKYIGTWKMEPLTIAVLKSLTPGDIETAFYDDRIENIDYNIDADLISISVETYTAHRAYTIADKFREKGRTVIMGGYHVQAAADEALNHADSVCIGNAENVWTQILNDYKSKKLQKIYYGCCRFSEALPDRSIFKGKKYLPISLIETGRGCPNKCEFCSITAFYEHKYIPRPIEQITAEIKQLKPKMIFFVDDNICADKNHLKELCRQLIPLKIRWTSQAALSIAEDDELLNLMAKSGCKNLLIGLESMEERNLDQMNKSWNYKLGETDKLINKIHKKGISIYVTFLFGFDFDNPRNFRRTIDFALKHKFFFAAFNHLLPFPGTPLYNRLKQEKRLLYDKWWLKEDYKYGDIPYIPKALSPIELRNFCADARREFFSIKNIIKRGIAQFLRNKDLLLLIIFVSQNLNLRREIDEKLNLPVGRGLDDAVYK